MSSHYRISDLREVIATRIAASKAVIVVRCTLDELIADVDAEDSWREVVQRKSKSLMKLESNFKVSLDKHHGNDPRKVIASLSVFLRHSISPYLRRDGTFLSPIDCKPP